MAGFFPSNLQLQPWPSLLVQILQGQGGALSCRYAVGRRSSCTEVFAHCLGALSYIGSLSSPSSWTLSLPAIQGLPLWWIAPSLSLHGPFWFILSLSMGEMLKRWRPEPADPRVMNFRLLLLIQDLPALWIPLPGRSQEVLPCRKLFLPP